VQHPVVSKYLSADSSTFSEEMSQMKSSSESELTALMVVHPSSSSSLSLS